MEPWVCWVSRKVSGFPRCSSFTHFHTVVVCYVCCVEPEQHKQGEKNDYRSRVIIHFIFFFSLPLSAWLKLMLPFAEQKLLKHFYGHSHHQRYSIPSNLPVVKGRAVAIEINLSVWCICMWGRPFECVCTWLSCKFGCKYTVAMIYINDAYMYLFAHYTYTLKYCKPSYVFLSASVACQSTSRWPHTYMQTVGIALVLKAHSKSSRFCGGSSWCLCIRTNVYIHIHGRQRGKIASA